MYKPAPPINPLQAFRGESKVALALHPLEQTVLVIVGVLLCFTPWALGTMHVWSQFISLGLAMSGFVVALINRHYSGEYASENEFKLIMWPKLIRFPIFWLGLAFLSYIVTQALNPAWILAINGQYAWLVPLDHITWLPAGIEAPLSRMNAWRALMIYGSAWLLVCALWVGITRRATLQHLFTIVVINGTVLAIIGILQRGMGTDKILWCIENVGGRSCFSTFIYKNHAGAYFNLVLMLAAALSYWFFARGQRRMQRSNPASVFAFCMMLLGGGVLLTHSKAATLLLIGFSIIAFLGFVARYKSFHSDGNEHFMTIGTLCGIFILFVAVGSTQLDIGTAFEKTSQMIQQGSDADSVRGRLIAEEAAWDMAKGNLVTGWGAGGFRHMFPMYQQNYPEIYYSHGNPNDHLYWEYAHNDYIQLLDELGLIGACLCLAMAVCGLICLIKNGFYQSLHLLFVVLALMVTLAHSWVDFIFHNPAVLLLWCASAAVVCRWSELENRRV